MLGNNETGVIQPVAVLASICRRAGVLIHTDAAQVVGKLPVHFRQLGVDAVSISAHKFHGPPGIGALIVRDGVLLEPLLLGGHQQGQLRPGSEAVALAVGMAKALAIWHEGAARRAAYLADLRDRFERQLIAGWPDAVINGAGAQRLPHTSNIGFAGVDRQALFMALDMASVACSTGSACASGSSERSAVLRAMGCEPPVIAGSLRFSFGALNTPEEVDEAVKRILKALRNLRRRIPARKSHHAPPAAVGKSL
jgi:cysteine desulfurase